MEFIVESLKLEHGMLHALQHDNSDNSSDNDDNDRWPYWSDDIDNDWEFGKAIEKDRPVEQKAVDEKLSGNKTNGKTNKAEGKSSRKQERLPESAPADLMRYASLGTELLASIIVGVLLAWAASWLIGLVTGHQPLWIIAIGVILGAIAGFFNMYRFVVEENEKEERRRRGSSQQ